MERPRGFSLVEMVLTIVMLSILASVAYPKISGLLSTTRGGAAAQKLLTDIRYTQRIAMAREKLYGIEFDVNLERYRVFDVSTGTNEADPFTGNPGVAGQSWSSGFVVNYPSHPELSGVTLTSTNFDVPGTGNQLRFDSLGRPRNAASALFVSAGSVALSSGGYSRTITVQPDTGYAEAP